MVGDQIGDCVPFNTTEGRSRDARDEIAAEFAQACVDRDETPPSLRTGEKYWPSGR